MQELGKRDEAEIVAQVEARLPPEYHRFEHRDRVGEAPVTKRCRQDLNFFVEKREENDGMPITDETKRWLRRLVSPERRRRGASDQVGGDQNLPLGYLLSKDQDQRCGHGEVHDRDHERVPGQLVWILIHS